MSEKIVVPHVYGALANILKQLSVAKGGVLPGNMGGKPYITAVDTAAEVKRQFVENNLIFLPQEKFVKHESHMVGDRSVKILTAVEGTYTIVSTVDGSSAVISGTGDGLANGTAVASNIASTNALKNALLRTFLITEQSVEDEAKNGSTTADADTRPPALRKAVSAAVKDDGVAKLKERIRVEFIEGKGVPKETVNSLVSEGKTAGKTGEALYQAVIIALEGM